MYKYGDTKHKAKHKARHKARHKAVNTKWNLCSIDDMGTKIMTYYIKSQ